MVKQGKDLQGLPWLLPISNIHRSVICGAELNMQWVSCRHAAVYAELSELQALDLIDLLKWFFWFEQVCSVDLLVLSEYIMYLLILG